MSDPAATNWLDVLRSAFWPGLALVALIMFQGPANKILGKVGDGGAQEIEAGPVKIKFSPAGLRQVPPPSPEVAKVLPKLTPGEIDALMSHPAGNSHPVCRPEALVTDSPTSRQKSFVYDKLFSETLVSFEDPGRANANTSWCRLNGLRMARLTENGASVREYLLSVIANSITISPS